MKLFAQRLTLVLLMALAQNLSVAQESTNNDNIIVITKTQIITPKTYDFGQVPKGSQVFAKFIIKNQRPNSVQITNIISPDGFGANIKKQTIGPEEQTELYIGFDSNWINADSTFEKAITLETNLIKDITIKVKGKIVENTDEQ